MRIQTAFKTQGITWDFAKDGRNINVQYKLGIIIPPAVFFSAQIIVIQEINITDPSSSLEISINTPPNTENILVVNPSAVVGTTAGYLNTMSLVMQRYELGLTFFSGMPQTLTGKFLLQVQYVESVF